MMKLNLLVIIVFGALCLGFSTGIYIEAKNAKPSLSYTVTVKKVRKNGRVDLTLPDVQTGVADTLQLGAVKEGERTFKRGIFKKIFKRKNRTHG